MQAYIDDASDGASDGEDDDTINLNTIGLISDDFARIVMRAEAVRASRVHWLDPDSSEAERLRQKSQTRPLSAKETSLLLYHDGSAGILGISAPPAVCWNALRKAVKARAIVIYWLGHAAERSCAEGGPGRVRDAKEFAVEFATEP